MEREPHQTDPDTRVGTGPGAAAGSDEQGSGEDRDDVETPGEKAVTGALGGAALGAVAGVIFPGVGSVLGSLVGAALGAGSLAITRRSPD